MSDDATPAPMPIAIELHKRSKLLELRYKQNGKEDESYQLSCEYLRVYSPSAEVKGHGPGQEVLQVGKKNISIDSIQPVGNYALQLMFSDGHDSGIFSWGYLYQMCSQQPQMWQDYLQRLEQAGAHRDPEIQVVRIGN
ncbi:MAG: DUF971 family protein [Oceanicoccus sp.]|jgi:DUF971 family protein